MTGGGGFTKMTATFFYAKWRRCGALIASMVASALLCGFGGGVCALVSLAEEIAVPYPGESSDFSAAQVEFFEKSVRPLLVERCYECHQGTKAKLGLRLDSRAGVLKGSDYHPVVDLRNPPASRLMLAVTHGGAKQQIEDMPKEADKLAAEEIAVLERWIADGLPWSAESGGKPAELGDPTKHWAWQQVEKPVVPNEAGHPIDYFIDQKLNEAGLAKAPVADRRTLYRRAHFDLLGLPPEFDEVEKFSADPRPDSVVWPELLDRLLASPHYGERWARHWMDLARYSDTRGYEAGGRERRFVYSYVYRDWLIRSLNEDLPYDEFLRQQLAADRLLGPDASAEERKNLAALGFITLSKNGRTEDVIDDRIDTTFRTTMAMTVACARCHDHKFDPVSTAEYYGIYSVFHNSVEPQEMPTIGQPEDTPVYRAYQEELAKKQKVVDDFLDPKLAEKAKEFPDLANRRFQLVAKLSREDRRALQNLERVVDKFVADKKMEPDKALVVGERTPPAAQRIFVRGSPGRQGDLVQRGFLKVLSPGGERVVFEQKDSGRLDLANLIASAENPLTARVMVNRVWMHHFGEGLVRSVSDFGIMGDAPTHPELLDWLATWFVENGWSLKKLHRLILTSETWRQQSVHPRAAEFSEIDPENRLLWKMHRQRLDFESMRDATLAVTGQLSDEIYGRSVKILEPPFSKRRTVYAFIDRQNPLPEFRIFDAANPQETTGQRPNTMIAPQALFAMNGDFVKAQAVNLANLPSVSAVVKGGELEKAVAALYRAVLARAPSGEETTLALDFVRDQQAMESPFHGRQNLTAWEYGYGGIDGETGKVVFTPFPVWSGKEQRWQVGAEVPLKDSPLSYLSYSSNGFGHPGNFDTESLVLRWTAPRSMSVDISGSLNRSAVGKGNGVLGRIIDADGKVRAEVTVFEVAEKGIGVKGMAVEVGDVVDFVVEPIDNNSFDSIQWEPVVSESGQPSRRWDVANDFAGPESIATAWQNLAQALLATNEFVYVD